MAKQEQLKLVKDEPSIVEVESAGGFQRPPIGGADQVDEAKIENQTTAITRRAAELTIDSAAEYADAAQFLKDCRAVVKEIDATFATLIKDAHTLHRNLIGKRDYHREPLQLAEREIKQRMGRWSSEQERIRVEREQAERKRLAQEAEDRRLAEAETLEATGQAEAADALIEAPPPPPPPVVIRTSVPKTKGISVRKVWKYRIVDFKLIPHEYLTVDEKKIGAVVRALKENAKIAGVEVYSEDSTSVKV